MRVCARERSVGLLVDQNTFRNGRGCKTGFDDKLYKYIRNGFIFNILVISSCLNGIAEIVYAAAAIWNETHQQYALRIDKRQTHR